MRRLLLITLTASLLAGCGASPTSRLGADKAKTAKAVAAQPLVRMIPGNAGPAPTVSVISNNSASAASVALAKEAAADMLAADSNLDAIETLIQDGAAYMIQGWFTDLKDAIKRTLVRWKLTSEVKSALKKNNEKAFELHEGEIDTIRTNRTQPVTKINTMSDGVKEVVTSWTSTHKGTFKIETRREVDAEGVTQVLTVSMIGKTDKGLTTELVRIRTLMGEDGSYKVATRRETTGKDSRKEVQEWLKLVNVDSSEKIAGIILHPDGFRTDITGIRDIAGKVNVQVSKISPAHAAK